MTKKVTYSVCVKEEKRESKTRWAVIWRKKTENVTEYTVHGPTAVRLRHMRKATA